MLPLSFGSVVHHAVQDDPHHCSAINNELMSITELRSKGESRRFLDEVGYLFEGLEEHGMTASVRRSRHISRSYTSILR